MYNEEPPKKEEHVCPYCEGRGEYTTYSWGVENRQKCRFCKGTGKGER